MDFDILPLLRFLFLTTTKTGQFQGYHHRIDQVLCDCPFWPNSENDYSLDCMKELIFWSENHIFMFLSSAVLYRQRCRNMNLPCAVGEKEESLLLAYLEAHTSFRGMYEVLSHVYLPYTFSALLNLFDFSESEHIRLQADILLNLILHQILLGTNRDGICTLTASARTYPKFRLKNWGHNVNMLVFFGTGNSVDLPRPSAITDFILTSTWEPSAGTLDAFFLTGFVRLDMNHSISHVRNEYASRIDPMECIPFYW